MRVEEICEFIFGVTPLLSIVRIKVDEDKFSWAGVARYRWPDEVEIKAVMHAPTGTEWKLLERYFLDKGLSAALYERHKGGTVRPHRIKLHG